MVARVQGKAGGVNKWSTGDFKREEHYYIVNTRCALVKTYRTESEL